MDKTTDPSQLSYSWGDMANLTHATQVETFGWCACEDTNSDTNPYSDCPTWAQFSSYGICEGCEKWNCVNKYNECENCCEDTRQVAQ